MKEINTSDKRDKNDLAYLTGKWLSVKASGLQCQLD